MRVIFEPIETDALSFKFKDADLGVAIYDALCPPKEAACTIPNCSDPESAKTALRLFGLFRGPSCWYEPDGIRSIKYKDLPPTTLLIYWPTVIEQFAELVLRYPALVALLWKFKELFFARNVATGSLLQQRINDYIALAFAPAGSSEHTDRKLFSEDHKILSALLSGLSKDTVFIAALKKAFESWVAGTAAPGFPAYDYLVDKYAAGYKIPAKQLSILDVGRLPYYYLQLPTCPDFTEILRAEATFTSPGTNTLSNELFFAMGLGRMGSVIPDMLGSTYYGIERFDYAKEKVLAINFAKLYSKRHNLVPNRQRFLGHRRKFEVNVTPERLPPPNIYEQFFTKSYIRQHVDAKTADLAQYFRTKYLNLLSSERDRVLWGVLKSQLGASWPDTDFASTVFFDYPKLRAFSVQTLAKRIKYITSPSKYRPRKTERAQPRRSVLHAMYKSTVTDAVIDFDIIFHDSNIWFNPKGVVIPVSDTHIKSTGKSRNRPVSGVHYDTPTGEHFYSVHFLKHCLVFDESVPSDVYDWMHTFDKYDRLVFNNLVKRQRYEKKYRQSSFSAEEDAAILRFYYPLESSKDAPRNGYHGGLRTVTAVERQELFKLCEPKTKAQVGVRARQLRRQLIDQGVYDINQLPHLVYNSKIGQEISAAKKKNGVV